MIDTQEEHLFNDRMIDNELNHRGYEVNCIRCNERLTVWYKCPYCLMITFCDCVGRPLCNCINSRTDIRGVIDAMKQLI